jgi:hypothetical protein
MRYLLLALICLPPAGCAVPSPSTSTYSTPAAPSPPSVTVKQDDFQKVTTWDGPNCAPNALSLLFLRAVHVDRENAPPTSYLIYVSHGYTDSAWHSYNQAFDSEGHPLSMRDVKHYVGNCSVYADSCSYADDFVLEVDKAYLIQHQGNGIRFQLSGKHGSVEFAMPASCISAFLAQVP